MPAVLWLCWGVPGPCRESGSARDAVGVLGMQPCRGCCSPCEGCRGRAGAAMAVAGIWPWHRRSYPWQGSWLCHKCCSSTRNPTAMPGTRWPCQGSPSHAGDAGDAIGDPNLHPLSLQTSPVSARPAARRGGSGWRGRRQSWAAMPAATPCPTSPAPSWGTPTPPRPAPTSPVPTPAPTSAEPPTRTAQLSATSPSPSSVSVAPGGGGRRKTGEVLG